MKLFLLMSCIVCSTMVLATAQHELTASAQQELVEEIYAYFSLELLTFETRDIDLIVDKIRRRAPEILGTLKKRVDADVVYYKQRVNQRDTTALKWGIGLLAGATTCFWLAYLLSKKKPAPTQQAIEAFCAQHGIVKPFFPPFLGLLSYRYQGSDPLLLSHVRDNLQRLVCDYDRQMNDYEAKAKFRENAAGYCAVCGALTCVGSYMGFHEWLYCYKMRYDKWCLIKLALDRALEEYN